MKWRAPIALACACLISGCATIQSHPRTAVVVTTIVVTSVALAVRKHKTVYDVGSTPWAPCQNVGDICR